MQVRGVVGGVVGGVDGLFCDRARWHEGHENDMVVYGPREGPVRCARIPASGEQPDRVLTCGHRSTAAALRFTFGRTGLKET